MRKRLLGLAVATALCLSTITPALAADPANMTDIGGHWAEPTITWCMEQELFQGMDESTFQPEGTMSRGMFVTVLGRLEGIDQDTYKDDYLGTLYPDVSADAWFSPSINWATRHGIINGMDDGTFQPDAPVTREQMAAMVIRYASNCNYELNTVAEAYTGDFTDLDRVAEYAREPLASLKATGILNGYPGDNGTYYFGPQNNATRAQCAAVFQRLSHARAIFADREWIAPETLTLTPETATMLRGETMPLVTELLPEDACNKTITWVSMDPTVASVDRNGIVTAVSSGTAEIRAYTYNGLMGSCTITCNNKEGLASANESFQDKCLRVFGRTYSNAFTARNAYLEDGPEVAASHMVTITVPVWNFRNNDPGTPEAPGEKISTTRTLRVHETMAETVKAIFQEIYEGDEQFPINDVGCYRWDPNSEHCVGLAIDINANSNYYINPKTGQQVGDHWDPENDPYSIPLEGDVVAAFQKYGYTRGFWSGGVRDYMHFSYFGT